MTTEQLMAALSARPAAAGGALGAAAGYAGEQSPLLSMLDAPGRAVRGGLMAGMEGAGLQTGLITTASFLPALVGLGTGALSAAIPGLAPAAGYLGAGAAGLTQQLGEYMDPANFASVSSGNLNTALGLPSNMATDLLTNVATDPLSYAGAIGKAAGRMNPVPGGYTGPPGTATFIPEPAPAPGPLTMPAGNLHVPGAAVGGGPEVDALLAGWQAPPPSELEAALAQMSPRQPLSPNAAPLPQGLPGLHVGAGRAPDPMLSGWQPPPGAVEDALTNSPSQWMAPEALGGTRLDVPPAGAGGTPGWMEQANAASLGGYAPTPQRLLPSLEQLAAPPAKSFYGSVQPDVAQSLQDLGYMNATSVSPGGRTSGTLQAALPEWASYRKPWLTNAPGEAVPLLGDQLNWLNEQQQAQEAMAAFARMMQQGRQPAAPPMGVIDPLATGAYRKRV